MKALVQRVKRASVTLEDGTITGAIDGGICVLIGISTSDTHKEADWITRKVLNLRLWPGDDGRPWQKSVSDLKLGILLVSQFTLYGNVKKGNKPDFHYSMPAERAEELFDYVVTCFKEQHPSVETGQFQAMMDVSLTNNGPITMMIESK
ncbi:hypothetical protein P9112_011827 [Eukaryota sp. TZLM1-RC]